MAWPPLHTPPGQFSLGKGPRHSIAKAGGGYGNQPFWPADGGLLTQFKDFTHADWTSNSTSESANSAYAPDDTLTADTITAAAAAAAHNIAQAATVADGAIVTGSVYLKYATYANMGLVIYDGTAKNYAILFNIQTGIMVGSWTGYTGYAAAMGSSITSVGANWYRVTLSADLDAGRTAPVFMIAFAENLTPATDESWTPAGTEAVYAWAGRLVAGLTV